GGQLGDVVGADAEVLALFAALSVVDDDHADPHRSGVPGAGAVGPDLDRRTAGRGSALRDAVGAGAPGRARRLGGAAARVGDEVDRQRAVALGVGFAILHLRTAGGVQHRTPRVVGANPDRLSLETHAGPTG